MSCINRSVIGHGPQDYALRVEMSALEDQADNGKARELHWKPMSWLGTLRPTTVDDAWAPAIWQTFFTSTLGLEVPVLSSLARQRRRRPPQIPAARGSPSRWRGRPRVGSGSGPPVRRRNAETRVRPHFGQNAARRQNSCSSATRETTPAIPGRPGQPIAMARSLAGRLNHPVSRVCAADTERRGAPACEARLTGRSFAAQI